MPQAWTRPVEASRPGALGVQVRAAREFGLKKWERMALLEWRGRVSVQMMMKGEPEKVRQEERLQ